MEGFASFVQVKPTLSDGRSIQWQLMPSGKQLKFKASIDGAKRELYSVPKATLKQQDFSLHVFERWLDEKFVVAAAGAEGVVAQLPTVPSPFRSNVRRRSERGQFEHSPGHQGAMEVRCHKIKVNNARYRRRHTGDLDDERVNLSERWNDLEEELEDEDEDVEWEDEHDEREDEAPVDKENAIKCKKHRRAKRACLAVAAQASERCLARLCTRWIATRSTPGGPRAVT
jgi:hypothetical protein